MGNQRFRAAVALIFLFINLFYYEQLFKFTSCCMVETRTIDIINVNCYAIFRFVVSLFFLKGATPWQ